MHQSYYATSPIVKYTATANDQQNIQMFHGTSNYYPQKNAPVAYISQWHPAVGYESATSFSSPKHFY